MSVGSKLVVVCGARGEVPLGEEQLPSPRTHAAPGGHAALYSEPKSWISDFLKEAKNLNFYEESANL